jgi:hypothetical protein
MTAPRTTLGSLGGRHRDAAATFSVRIASLALLVFAGLLSFGVPAQAAEPFSIEHFSSTLIDSAGNPVTQAGSHPFAMETIVGFGFHRSQFHPEAPLPPEEPTGGDVPNANAKDVRVVLPKGVVANPNATAVKCTEQQLELVNTCPNGSAIGVLNTVLETLGSSLKAPIYNMAAPPGVPAEFGFNVAGLAVGHIDGGVRTGDGYNLTADVSNISEKLGLMRSQVILWGNPSDVVHDPQRGTCDDRNSKEVEAEERELENGEKGAATTLCRVDRVGPPFLTMPTSCSAASLQTTMTVETWQEPGVLHPAEADAPPASSCGLLAFEPSITARPDTTSADSPSGFDFSLHVPQPQSFEGLAEADLENVSVTLPPGLVIDPSSANGLAACTPAQIGLENDHPATCPAASRIGEVEVATPLLEHPLGGSVYLAAQNDNPFHALLAGYIVAEGSGVLIKLPGKFETNPVTGQITASFKENPQLPFEDFKLSFFGGPRAPLTTPATCGRKEVATDLTPWTAPEGLDAYPSTSFEVASGAGGSPCASSEAELPNKPSFEAGTINPIAGSYSPFVLKLSRENGSQRLSAVNVALPPGLTGKLAGVQECSEAQLAAATGRQNPGEGALEQASPSCPAAAELGSVIVGAGSGSPLLVGGHAYLAGPYKGAPFSLVIITPAVAGPFDLGTVVVRSGLYINPETAQVTVKSDPIPTILAGIPLDIRSIAVTVSRPEFMLNPTSCDAMLVSGEAISTLNQAVSLSNRFQAANCASLPFKPSFTATTQGRTSKANGASLIVKIGQKPGEANIHKVNLQLPIALPSRLTTLQKACTEAQFNTNPAGCPEGSFIGTATAHTPILSAPLTGPAILVSHGGAAFPDVVFLLQGEGVHINLDGKTDIKKGITYSRFETVPDAPISSFETVLPQGPHSVLAVNGNLCALTKIVTSSKKVTRRVHGHSRRVTVKVKKTVAQPLTMPTTITGQNGAVTTQTTKIAVTGCTKAKVKKKAKKAKRKGKKKR